MKETQTYTIDEAIVIPYTQNWRQAIQKPTPSVGDFGPSADLYKSLYVPAVPFSGKPVQQKPSTEFYQSMVGTIDMINSDYADYGEYDTQMKNVLTKYQTHAFGCADQLRAHYADDPRVSKTLNDFFTL